MHPQHLPRIRQSQRARVHLHAGGGDTGDLQRHIRANAHHAVGHRVHHAKHFGRKRRPGTFQKMFLEFDERRFDLLIAIAREHLHEGTVNAGLPRRGGRQHVSETGRQQAFFRIVVHHMGL